MYSDPQLNFWQARQSDLARAMARVPRPLLSKLAELLGGPPVNNAGDMLAPDVWLGLQARKLQGAEETVRGASAGADASVAEVVAQARRGLDIDAFVFSERLQGAVQESEVSIPPLEGYDAPAVAATRYHPAVSRGLLVYFHGGGWVVGSRRSHAGVCRFIALEAEIDVLSVEYRLAPEHRFPAAVQDAYAAWEFAARAAQEWGLAPDRLVVAGDSAGGNLAAVVAQRFRSGWSATPPPILQVLLYPATDLSYERDSCREFATGFQLTLEQARWYKRLYVRSAADYLDPRASPLLAEDLTGVAPAHIAVAGFDPLRDEGLDYATKLRDAGVAVEVYRAGSLIHGYVSLTAVSSDARAAALDTCRAIRRAL